MVNTDYQLSAHVRACRVGAQVILLDLRRGQYLGLPTGQVARLARRVRNLPGVDHESALDEPPEDQLRSLRLKGLITDRSHAGQPLQAIDEPIDSLHATDTVPDVPLDARSMWAMMRCAGGTSLSLRFQSLHRIALRATKRRRCLALAAERHPTSVALDRLRDRVAVYERLRPLLFTSRDQCLFDSLALLGFLALDGLFATWVVGVKTQPFGAHSWLQHGSTVLNDQHDRVRRFTPILVV